MTEHMIKSMIKNNLQQVQYKVVTGLGLRDFFQTKKKKPRSQIIWCEKKKNSLVTSTFHIPHCKKMLRKEKSRISYIAENYVKISH